MNIIIQNLLNTLQTAPISLSVPTGDRYGPVIFEKEVLIDTVLGSVKLDALKDGAEDSTHFYYFRIAYGPIYKKLNISLKLFPIMRGDELFIDGDLQVLWGWEDNEREDLRYKRTEELASIIFENKENEDGPVLLSYPLGALCPSSEEACFGVISSKYCFLAGTNTGKDCEKNIYLFPKIRTLTAKILEKDAENYDDLTRIIETIIGEGLDE